LGVKAPPIIVFKLNHELMVGLQGDLGDGGVVFEGSPTPEGIRSRYYDEAGALVADVLDSDANNAANADLN
jgi:hypothetical protein